MVGMTINGEGRRLDYDGVVTRGVGWTPTVFVQASVGVRRPWDQTLGKYVLLTCRRIIPRTLF